MTFDLNALAEEIHVENAKWWVDLYTGEPIERNKGEALMLIVSEIAEAMEAERKSLMDSHLPHRRGAEVELADAVIRILDAAKGFGIKIGDEDVFNPCYQIRPRNKGELLFGIVCCLAVDSSFIYNGRNGAFDDCLACIVFYCNLYDYDLWGAVNEKRAYNLMRQDHKVEARKAEGGKKF